ncbi:MAG TPA: FadR/GntR family transcriptional regulator [Ktedonobacteraceae bacterium]|nr:FadR/GntR family transcriptional regulator [Ktedonobacteraceae bacterium]
MYFPIRSTRVYEQVAEQIENLILSGELQSGDRLPTERELAVQFHVSRTAVREAMKLLEQKGLVDMRPGRGTLVIDGTSQAVRHSLGLMMRVGQQGNSINLVEVRELLEPGIAALAAERASEEEIAAMREAIAVMDANLENADAYIAADNNFHRSLAKATQNPVVLALIDSIVDLLSEQRKLIFTVDGGPQRGQCHHKHLLETILRRDQQAAREAMQAHMRQVRADVAHGIASSDSNT